MAEDDHDELPGLAEGPHYHGHRERLRDRFRQAGTQALSDYELLELVLFRAIPQRDVKPLAKDLIEEFGSFAEVISAPMEQLKKVKGLGEAAATDLKIMQAVAGRMTQDAVNKRDMLSSWPMVLDYCRTKLAFDDKESFHILFLNKRNHLIKGETQQTG